MGRQILSIKVFHVIAEEVDRAFDTGLRAQCWAYNGHVTSTVIEAVEGEQVRLYVTNRLPVATSAHWHSMYLPDGIDGVGGLTQPYINPGETAKYEFTLRQHATFMFHSHHDEMTQMGMGLIGLFVIHPRGTVALNASAAEIARDGIDIYAPTPKASAPRAGSRGHASPTPIPGHTHR